MKKTFFLWILSASLFGCDAIPEGKLSIIELKKASLRYFVTINYSAISNEMTFGEADYLTSLYAEIASFKKSLPKDRVKGLFLSIPDPFDFAVSITKELD